MKKVGYMVSAIVLCFALAISMTACKSGKEPASESTSASAAQSSVKTDDGSNADTSESLSSFSEPDVLAECTLSDDEMASVVEEYFKLFSDALAGGTTEIEYKSKDGQITVSVTETVDGEKTSWTPFEWESAREAYRYLYTQGQVDLEGNILVTTDDLNAAS